MPNQPLTLMAVHAHPDDESVSTGGMLARYSAEGVRTVLVTCTDGRCGDGPGGVKPGEDGHDPDEVVRMRTGELRRSCEILGITHLEQLGYRDSGMMGWPTNDEPGAFWGMDVMEAARPLVALMHRYQPQVVVTYDANGFYGHPDHIMAHRIAMVAVAASGVPAKLYYTAIPRSGVKEFTERLKAAGIEPPQASEREEGRYAVEGETAEPAFGSPDALITTRLDVATFTAAKRRSLAAHGSQADNIFFLQFDDEVFDGLFGTESFIRAVDRTGVEVPESDLFEGVRPGA